MITQFDSLLSTCNEFATNLLQNGTESTDNNISIEEPLKEEEPVLPLRDLIAEALETKGGELVKEFDVNSLNSLKEAAQSLNCGFSIVSENTALIRKLPSLDDLLEIRICCCGNVDAGKSTLLGVLTSGSLDDGRGKARVALFKHKHEIESGRTSSVGMEIMGFDQLGKQVVQNDAGRRLSWEELCKRSSKLITFLDLAGHEKYLKTTIFGMTGCAPDYVLLIIGANAGMIGMAKEHLGLAMALNVPVMIIISKVDMCPPNILDATLKQLSKVLKSNGCRRIPLFIKDMNEVVVTSQSFVLDRICPIFQISSVSGTGMDLLIQYLNLLPNYKQYNSKLPVEYPITDTYSVPGVGTVVSGTLLSGKVNVGDTLLIGPDENGNFFPTQVKSMHRKRVPVTTTVAGQSPSFALRKIKRTWIRKGMILISRELQVKACLEFSAEVLTIAINYQAMVHCGGIRQAAKIIAIELHDQEASISFNNINQKHPVDNETKKCIIRTGDRAIIRFRFIQNPEYIKPGSRMLFREGRTKGVGKVLQVYNDS